MIHRDPSRASQVTYDLLVVGGGIYGACLLLEAARRGLRCLMLERDDFGGATSWSSLRVLHGGLRYLQTLDLPRFRESVDERKWFCQQFPDLVRPLPCLMPLYGDGLKRPTTFRMALAMNDWLSRHRNRGIGDEVRLPDGRVLSVRETIELFPSVYRQGLKGAGLWYDAVMINSQRVLIEILHWACALGGRALNYVEGLELVTEAGRAVGVKARDRIGGVTYEFRGGAVANCAGPWSRQVATNFDRDVRHLFRPSLAFNVLLNRAPLSEAAVAVEPKTSDGHVYFMLPWRGRILAGTAHLPWRADVTNATPSEADLDAFIKGLNSSVPGLDLERADIVRVYAGLLPTTRDGSAKLTKREVIHDHGRYGGPRGLVSVCGIKYTTARLVAQKALHAINKKWRKLRYREGSDRRATTSALDLTNPDQLLAVESSTAQAELERVVREEAVVELDDLLLRRTDWGSDPATYDAVRQRVCELLHDPTRQEQMATGRATSAASNAGYAV